MALLLRLIYNNINGWSEATRDDRLAGWPLVGSPWPTLGILGAYVYVCTVLGPRWMRDRQPFRIGGLISAYNALQIVWNAFVAGYILYATMWQGDHTFHCQPIIYDKTPRQQLLPIATYLYYAAKIIDLFDTVFFILRKKFGHVSFLHIYHHTLMVAVMYVAVNFMPGGHSWLLAFANSIVHVFMYGYYLLASYAPNLRSLGAWKRRVTQIQMTQFVVLVAHYSYGLSRSNCGDYPKAALTIGVVQNAFMLLMFADFYRKSYASAAEAEVRVHLKEFVRFVKRLLNPDHDGDRTISADADAKEE